MTAGVPIAEWQKIAIRKYWFANEPSRIIARRVFLDKASVTRFTRREGLKRRRVYKDPETLRRIADDMRSGLSYSKTAKKNQVSEWMVRVVAKKIGTKRTHAIKAAPPEIEPFILELYDNKWKADAIAHLLRYSRSYIMNVIKRGGRPMAQRIYGIGLKRKALAACRLFEPTESIAARLGITQTTVRKWRKEAGIAPPLRKDSKKTAPAPPINPRTGGVATMFNSLGNAGPNDADPSAQASVTGAGAAT